MDPEEEQLELLQEQLERRRRRGAEDLAKIVNQGRHPVYSTFEVTSTSDRVYTVQLIDEEGTVCAEVEKTLYVRRKNQAEPEAKP